MKYQFCIRFQNTTTNSAATKAISDCNKIFLDNGYLDYSFTVWDNSNKFKYYLLLIKEVLTFFFAIKKGSIVGIQYPLLSINSVFKYFIRLARLKGIKFFCVIHDLESLRTGGTDNAAVDREIKNLNNFDCVIVHNPRMLKWLQEKGLRQKWVNLQVFDYLSHDFEENRKLNFEKRIVYAGNLAKSTFVYSLPVIQGWHFNLYGPNFTQMEANNNVGVKWQGQYNPEEIVRELKGSFGLIWDGSSVEKCDEILGNYLRYNNPHKFSLYIAAGLPVIAPEDSAIAGLITSLNIGVLINSVNDLINLEVAPASYSAMKSNVLQLRSKIINGDFFANAVKRAEKEIGI